MRKKSISFEVVSPLVDHPTTFFTPIMLPQFGHLCSTSFNDLIKNGIKQSGGRSKSTRAINHVPKPIVCSTSVITGFLH